jgi:predicted Zn-ribbon and HTH transcriptional regulator
MAAKETNFKCLMCGYEYVGMFDPKNVTERTCPKCRSNSVRKMPSKTADVED